ncbi:MAG: tetratricopeptide repeat protein [Deltaproteobacteria bacterium]|nr:tetratricopeptide repeat protein [Deltaproteobacteria bacterium]
MENSENPKASSTRPATGILAALILLVISTVLIYSNSFHSPFLFDDEIYIVSNEAIRLLSNFWPPSGSRYLSNLSFALNFYFNGLNPYGYHLVNIIIHIINSMLVYALVRVVSLTPVFKAKEKDNGGGAEAVALISALLFAAHPVQTESVTYITQRFASLATLFYLSSVVLYVASRLKGLSRAPYVLSILFSIFAMKTKEISFTMPFIIILSEIVFFGVKGFGERYRYLIPPVMTIVIIPLYFLLHQPEAGMGISDSIVALQNKELEELSRYEYLITEFRVIVSYLRLLVFPAWQNLLYELPTFKSILNIEVLASFAFLLALFTSSVVLLIRSVRRGDKYLILFSMGVIWFFITISIESSIIPIQDVMFEHRLYLPSAGAFIAVASIFFYGLDYLKLKLSRKAAVAIWIVFVIVPLGAVSFKRNTVWRDDVTLWSDVVLKSPKSSLAHQNLGAAYYKRRMPEKAMAELREAVRLEPDFFLPHYNLASLYQEIGRYDEAIREFKEVLRVDPANAQAVYNLGLSYKAKGMAEEALTEYAKALKLRPDYIEVRYALGDAYKDAGRADEAIENYLVFIDSAPEHYRQYKDAAAYKIQALKGAARRAGQ